MKAQLSPQLFDNHTSYRDTFPLYFHQITWNILEKEGIVKYSTPQELLENYFYGCILFDLYRKFEVITIGEEWSMQDELDYPNDKGYQYHDMCQLLNISPVTITDLYSEEEIQANEWTQSDIEQILNEERPSFAELYQQYIRQPYRHKAFSALKKHLNLSELFTIMLNATSYDRFDRQYQEHMEDTDENYETQYFDMDTLEDFNASLERHETLILSDTEFLRAFEWLDRNY